MASLKEFPRARGLFDFLWHARTVWGEKGNRYRDRQRDLVLCSMLLTCLSSGRGSSPRTGTGATIFGEWLVGIAFGCRAL